MRQLKITVLATGGSSIGEFIESEALQRGHVTTWFPSQPDNPGAEEDFVERILECDPDSFSLEHSLVDAFALWTPKSYLWHEKVLKHLCDICSYDNKQLLIVGNAGVLYVDDKHTKQIMYTPDFPNENRPRALVMAKEISFLRKRDDVKWTYICPALDFRVEGERTGKYIIGGEELLRNSKDESVISYSDFAAAVIDEFENEEHVHQVINVVAK